MTHLRVNRWQRGDQILKEERGITIFDIQGEPGSGQRSFFNPDTQESGLTITWRGGDEGQFMGECLV